MACDTENQMAEVFNYCIDNKYVIDFMLQELQNTIKIQNEEQCTFVLQQFVANFKLFTTPVVNINKVQ